MSKLEIIPSPLVNNNNLKTKSVPLYTAIDIDVYNSLEKYCKDYGHRRTQDVVRLAIAQLLKKEGYL